MTSDFTAVIIVDVLQVSLDLLDGGLGSYSGTGVTSAVEGNEVPGIEAERVSHVSEVADQEPMTVPETQTEHSVSDGVPYRVCPELPAGISVYTSETNILI
jgi:hypothetical protein